MSRKRIAGAVVVFAGLYVTLSEASSQFGEVLWSSRDMRAHTFWFVSALAGALVARSRFLGPAVTTWAMLWVFAVALLCQVAAGAGPGSVFAIVQDNAVGLGLSLLAVLLGVFGGQYFAEKVRRRGPAAA
jgi:drug/metabolite transporter (DMT)-like permease